MLRALDTERKRASFYIEFFFQLTNEFLEEPVASLLEYLGEDQRSQTKEELDNTEQNQDDGFCARQVHR